MRAATIYKTIYLAAAAVTVAEAAAVIVGPHLKRLRESAAQPRDPRAISYPRPLTLPSPALPVIRYTPPRRAKRKEQPATTWGDYPVNCRPKRIVWPSPVVQVTFADGENVRASFATLPNKPLNMGRAVRVARAFYLERIKASRKFKSTAAIKVPEVAACHVEHDSQKIVFPAAIVNEKLRSMG